MIAQMFMRNETTAVPMMQRYNVSYVVVFVTYASTQQGGQPSFLGAGEDGKWYWMVRIDWMVRIANQTSYDNQTILFQEKRATTGTTTTVSYYRLLKSGDKIIANETISSGQNLNDNSVLGFMMNTGVGISKASSDYFDRVFASSNNFVLVYKVLYPTNTIAKINIDKDRVKYGESVHITGTLTDSKGAPKSGVVTLQDNTEGSLWDDIATLTLVDGKFSHDWTPPAGNHSLRVSWAGIRGESLPTVSNSVSLFVEAKVVTLTLSVSNYNVTLGENVTISLRLSEKLSNGTLAIQYSVDNKTWVGISTVQPKNGTVEYSWRPPKAGALYIQATYSGSGNFGPATSTVVVLYVKP
jgi:hypothetical protein